MPIYVCSDEACKITLRPFELEALKRRARIFRVRLDCKLHEAQIVHKPAGAANLVELIFRHAGHEFILHDKELFNVLCQTINELLRAIHHPPRSHHHHHHHSHYDRHHASHHHASHHHQSHHHHQRNANSSIAVDDTRTSMAIDAAGRPTPLLLMPPPFTAQIPPTVGSLSMLGDPHAVTDAADRQTLTSTSEPSSAFSGLTFVYISLNMASATFTQRRQTSQSSVAGMQAIHLLSHSSATGEVTESPRFLPAPSPTYGGRDVQGGAQDYDNDTLARIIADALYVPAGQGHGAETIVVCGEIYRPKGWTHSIQRGPHTVVISCLFSLPGSSEKGRSNVRSMSVFTRNPPSHPYLMCESEFINSDSKLGEAILIKILSDKREIFFEIFFVHILNAAAISTNRRATIQTLNAWLKAGSRRMIMGDFNFHVASALYNNDKDKDKDKKIGICGYEGSKGLGTAWPTHTGGVEYAATAGPASSPPAVSGTNSALDKIFDNVWTSPDVWTYLPLTFTASSSGGAAAATAFSSPTTGYAGDGDGDPTPTTAATLSPQTTVYGGGGRGGPGEIRAGRGSIRGGHGGGRGHGGGGGRGRGGGGGRGSGGGEGWSSVQLVLDGELKVLEDPTAHSSAGSAAAHSRADEASTLECSVEILGGIVPMHRGATMIDAAIAGDHTGLVVRINWAS